MSKAIQELFTSIAPSYDLSNHVLSLSIDKRWRHRAVSCLKNRQAARILDLCAGTLDLTQKITELLPRSSVYAADFALAMLEAGEKKISQRPHAHRICADGHALPFADQAFDAVFCAFGIRNLEDRLRALSEIYRVLKPGGELVVLEFFRPDNLFSRLFYRTYGRHLLPRIGGVISKNRSAYQYLQDSICRFVTVKEYGSLLRQRGFSLIEAQALSGGIVHRVYAQRPL